jgi:two-component system, NarL family, nitrate/nitrite response regulator NarL
MGAGCNVRPRPACHAARIAPRILIVDDNPSFLAAARSLLEAEGLHVVALASTGSEAVEVCTTLHPDIALVDVTLEGESGFEVTRVLARDAPATELILISTHDERDYLELIADSPARGFLAKSQLSAGAILSLLAPNGSSGT